jgi:hypothetical protein
MDRVRRHPVPEDSFQPGRPLNDLSRAQLEHFVHVAQTLPPSLTAGLVPPSFKDGEACSRYIGAITAALMSLREPVPIGLVSSRPRTDARKPIKGLALAASVSPKKTAKKIATRKAATRNVTRKGFK